MNKPRITRRDFALSTAATGAALLGAPSLLRATAALGGSPAGRAAPLAEFGYGDVSITSAAHEAQLENTREVLMNLSEDSLLKPFRRMAGRAAPGADLGGWYDYLPDYDWHKDDAGFAPGATFGQWISALSRAYAIKGSSPLRDKVLRLNRQYAAAIGGAYFENNRFPAYCYDKLLLGLLDSHRYLGDPDATRILEKTTAAALPHMPAHAVDRELEWRPGKDQSYRWDESYTNPENLFLAYQQGAGTRYRDLAVRYLDDATWFDPLARGENVLAGKHAYSYVNSLSSAMQAYLTMGSTKHLRAAENGFRMLSAQSYATGGWGPDEMLGPPADDGRAASLEKTHNSFETPCGAYAHFKLTRYLLRVSRDSLYGDSMERVMYNTVLGALPMRADGRAFYYADYHVGAHKVYSNHGFPCCSGTLPQVAADYRINTYFHDADAVYVNLYLPSRLNWRQRGVPCSLTQTGDYPYDDSIALRVGVADAVDFTLLLRIPAWAEGARIDVNGKSWASAPVPGRFLAVARRWRDDDRIELQLPRKLRLESIDARQPGTAALLCGPLALFAVHESGDPPVANRRELLAATQAPDRSWAVNRSSGGFKMLPYTAIDTERYSLYLRTVA